jgi:hypothetical protein
MPPSGPSLSAPEGDQEQRRNGLREGLFRSEEDVRLKCQLWVESRHKSYQSKVIKGTVHRGGHRR